MIIDEKTVIRIYYELIEPKAGVYFVDPQKNDEDELPVMFTHNQVVGAGLWFPCLDEVHSLSTYEFQITTPPSAVAVCTGDLVQQVLNDNGTLKTSYFSLFKWPIAARSVALAVGPFKVYADPELPYVTHFYLDSHSSENIKHTVEFTHRAFKCYEEFLGMRYTDFFGSYKQVFIDNSYSQIESYATLAIIDSSLILDPKIIDNTKEVRKQLATMIARQFFGHFIYSRKWADLWLIIGLSGFLGFQFVQEEFGKNELRYFLYREGKNLLKLETHVQPLYCLNYSNPAELLTPYLIRKSPLVIYMIDRLAQSNVKKLLNTFLQKCIDAGKNRYEHRTLSTKEFLQAVKKTYLIDLKQFAEYWIYSTGVPQFDIHFTYDADRSVVSLRIKQILSHPNAKPFVGTLKLRLHETEGLFDSPLDIDKEVCNQEVQCRSKPRKKQRKKMFEEGLASVLDKEEDLELARIEIPIRWIRIDPDLDWIRVLRFQQKADMWMKQLEMDKDVVAQHEAVTALTSETQKSADVFAKYESILADKHYFYQVRVQTAYVLSRFADSALRNQAMGLLIKSFKSKYYDDKMIYLKPNDFSDFAEYFVKKEIPLALSTFVDEQTKMTPLDVTDFLVELLKHNDDSKNEYSSTFYVSNLIKALGQVDSDETERFVKGIRRLLVMDSLLPSHQQCISVESLLSLSNIMAKGKIPFDSAMFLQYYKKGKTYFVRVAAWRALLTALQSQLLVLEDNMNDEEEQPEDINLRTIEQAFFDEFLGMIENSNETPRFKFEITEITMKAIQRCSSMLILAYQDRVFDPNDLKSMSPMASFLTSIRSPAISNRAIVDRIWVLLRGPVTEFDFRLRFSIAHLYSAIWGNVPACYSTTKKSMIGLDTIYIAKNVLMDDDMAVDNDVLSGKPGRGGEEEEEELRPPPPKEKAKKRKRESGGGSSTANSSGSTDEFEFKPPEPKKKKTSTSTTTTPAVTTTIANAPAASSLDAPKETKTPSIRVKITLPKNELLPDIVTAPVIAPVKRSQEEEEEYTRKQVAEQDAIQRDMEANGGTERIVMIYIEQSRIKVYARMYVNATADAIFRSCPMSSASISGQKGIVWFPLPGMEKVTLEPLARSIVDNGELAYWVAGNSLCIAYAKTAWSVGNEIRLLEPCSIFGKMLYTVRNLNKSVGMHAVHIQRVKRLMLTIQSTEDYALSLDVYDKHFELLISRIMEQISLSSCVELFGRLLYFQVPTLLFDPKEFNLTTTDPFYRDYLYPGEVAFWIEGKSILLGTGETGMPKQNKKQNTFKLLAKCLVFGRIVTANFMNIIQKVAFVDPIHLHERKISITIGNASETKVTFIATLNETTTADRIYDTLMIQKEFKHSIKLWGQCLYFDSGDTITETSPMLPELNHMKDVVKPGELAYWCDTASICIAFGKTEASKVNEPRLLVPCNIWGEITSHTSEEVKQVLTENEFSEDDEVTIRTELEIRQDQFNFVRRHSVNLRAAAIATVQTQAQQQQTQVPPQNTQAQ
jgi:transcription initiation factor TFIID subunit 2